MRGHAADADAFTRHEYRYVPPQARGAHSPPSTRAEMPGAMLTRLSSLTPPLALRLAGGADLPHAAHVEFGGQIAAPVRRLPKVMGSD